jgi:E3 ubiquitin-protein ligase DOA10
LDFGRVWGGLSYRRSLDGAQYIEGNSVGDQKLQYITPILGVNVKNFMFSYTYSHLMGDVKFDSGGFHQITLGLIYFVNQKSITVIVQQSINIYNMSRFFGTLFYDKICKRKVSNYS